MAELIIVIMSIVLTVGVVLIGLYVGPNMETGVTSKAFAQVQTSVSSLESLYSAYGNAHSGATPTVNYGAADGGILTTFGQVTPVTPPAPVGFQWSYGYNATRAQNWFCLSATPQNPGGASEGLFKAFARLKYVYSPAQYFVTQGGKANCGSTTSIDTSKYSSNVALTYFVTPAANFSPASIPGLALWLDGQDASTVMLSGGTVYQWNDKSGNKNNAIAYSSNRPTYQANTATGFPAVAFTGAGKQYLEVNAASSIALTTLDSFAVVNANSYGPDTGVFYQNSTSTAAYSLGFTGGPSAPVYTFGVTTSSAVSVTPSGALLPSATGLYEGSYVSGAGVSASLNRVTGSQTLSGPLPISAFGLDVGRGAPSSATSYFDGVIGEIVIYNHVLTAAERLRLQHYFAGKWNINAVSASAP
ncbi:LamG domain-containing protein [Paraburkholderia sp. UCT31]|uniref:hypothetical protein n=1 Tax=Paraburkholderia sp. UCT31 TaxID=2615209 RepID=UPI001655CC33|nr:hypothetical protein [Paraburkholderia sp. UCT31]MBC8737406.1 LamG domain-containing protein [Paraburkholderia sp. UCT31]